MYESLSMELFLAGFQELLIKLYLKIIETIYYRYLSINLYLCN